jgi:hypothetical protein
MKTKIPIRLVPESNSSEHWTKKAKRHKIQKVIVKSYLQREKLPPLPCIVTLTRFSPRELDRHDNLASSFKWILDQVCDSLIPGLAPGRADSDPRISVVYKQEKTKEKEHYITIEIFPNVPENEIHEGFILDHILM